MARKPVVVRINSESVQGEGSYVEYRRLTWGERKEARDTAAKLKDKDFEKWAFKFLVDHIVGWNWTDVDGRSLPLPSKPEDLDALMDEEFDFLMDIVTDSIRGKLVYDDEAKKN